MCVWEEEGYFFLLTNAFKAFQASGFMMISLRMLRSISDTS